MRGIRRWAALALVALGVFLPGAALAQRVGETFGDWVVECTALGANQTACSINQTLISEQTREALAKFTVSRNPQDGTAVLLVLMPLGIDLTAPVTGSVDEGTPFAYAVQTCLAPGCIATYTIDSTLLLAMKNGSRLNLNLTMFGAQQASGLAGSLVGFTAGAAAVGVE